MAADAPYGFVGLGQMGGPMAANLAQGGFAVLAYDKAGTEARLPEGARAADALAEMAQACETVFLSVPDGDAVHAVNAELCAAPDPRVKTVIDLSTIGIPAAQAAAERCASAGIAYVDCPVSGGRAGAIAGSISVMWAGPADLLETHRPALTAFARNIFHVGATPGQGQALKLLNNFLSATAMAATAEAVHFGMAQGLDMKTILDAVNVSTGESRSSREKYVDRVLTGSFDSGFSTALMAKDVALYAEAAGDAGTAQDVGALMAALWRSAAEGLPGSDHTEIFRFLAGGRAARR